jgi:hypothetical protein
MRSYDSVGVSIPEILLPRGDIDLAKWSVIACDQYTSQPDYWKQVERLVGEAPSTLHLIYPEAYLGEARAGERIGRIRETMADYLRRGVLRPHEGLVYVERQIDAKTRRGVVACVDLDRYDFSEPSESLIRATEGTLLGRLPPRIRVREQALLELPHVMVLVDDPQDTVIGPLASARNELVPLYDFELMLGGGRLSGRLVQDPAHERAVIAALEHLRGAETFSRKYGVDPRTPVLLFAVGDGNHSLATARSVWNSMKAAAADPRTLEHSPARHALVEIVNLHDPALQFEPIHRVVFDVREGSDPAAELLASLAGRARSLEAGSLREMRASVAGSTAACQRIGVIRPAGYSVLEIPHPRSNQPVGDLQGFLDGFLAQKKARDVDYIHGTDTADELGRKQGNTAFFLPVLDKRELFRTVILDGPLPRKAFSMGEADEKRFYMECRKLA